MTSPPDWAIAVPSTPGVHPSGTALDQFTRPFTQAQLIQLGVQFLEQFLKRVVLALTGSFIPGGGPAFNQLSDLATNLFNLLGNPAVGQSPGSFDLLTSLENLINGRLVLPGLLVSQNDVLGVGATHNFPYTFPIDWSASTGGVTPQASWFERLRAMLGTDLTRTDFNPADALQQFITNSLLPQNLLAQLLNGKLPDTQAPPIIQNLIDTYAQTILGIATTNNPFAIWAQAVAAVFAGFTGAQQQAITASTNATAALAAVSTPGTSFTDFYDHPAGVLDVGGTGHPYKVRYSDNDNYNGYIQYTGQGTLDFQIGVNGVITKQGFAVETDHATSTDTQEITAVFGRVVETFQSGDESYTYILGRVNNTATSFVWARIGYNTATVGYCNASGPLLAISSVVPITPAVGDVWKFQLGFSGAPGQFVLKQNNATIIDCTDAVNPSSGAAFRFGGVGMEAGRRDFGATQTKPANVDSLTVADRTP